MEGEKPIYGHFPHVTPLVFRKEIKIAKKCRKMYQAFYYSDPG
jgi:hypothetical protein